MTSFRANCATRADRNEKDYESSTLLKMRPRQADSSVGEPRYSYIKERRAASLDRSGAYLGGLE